MIRQTIQTPYKLQILIEVDKVQKGTYTYDEGVWWEMPAVCVLINYRYSEYTLNNYCYLDYKDSLQVASTILHFDSEEEAENFARNHGLNIEYIHLNE